MFSVHYVKTLAKDNNYTVLLPCDNSMSHFNVCVVAREQTELKPYGACNESNVINGMKKNK